MSTDPQAPLDIRGVPCPINFVKTKLALEKIAAGQTLEVLVSGDAMENVPTSVKDEGHTVVSETPEGDYLRVVIQKA